MNDLFGNHLKIGDKVVIPAPRYRHLVTGIVVRITNFKVVVLYRNTWNFPGVPDGRPETFHAARDQIVKIEPVPPAGDEPAQEVPSLGPSSIGETDQPLLHNR